MACDSRAEFQVGEYGPEAPLSINLGEDVSAATITLRITYPVGSGVPALEVSGTVGVLDIPDYASAGQYVFYNWLEGELSAEGTYRVQVVVTTSTGRRLTGTERFFVGEAI